MTVILYKVCTLIYVFFLTFLIKPTDGTVGGKKGSFVPNWVGRSAAAALCICAPTTGYFSNLICTLLECVYIQHNR